MAYERLNLEDGEVLTAAHITHMEEALVDYEKLGLQDGDVLTAAHIVHLEDGIVAALEAAESKDDEETTVVVASDGFMTEVTVVNPTYQSVSVTSEVGSGTLYAEASEGE